jgi:hypothetical protein
MVAHVSALSVAIGTNVVRSNPVRGEVYLIQKKIVSDLRQVGGFLRVIFENKYTVRNM